VAEPDPGSLPMVPMHELPEGGILPEKHTPEAVVYLRRLALSSPVCEGVNLSEHLFALASELNAVLPADARVGEDDPRTTSAYEDVSDRAAMEAAVVALGAYAEDEEKARIAGRRQTHFISLERYFAWARAMRDSAIRLEAEVVKQRSTRGEHDLPHALDDLGEAQLGLILHWMASLWCVIEGWLELDLHDDEIDPLIASGGNPTVEGSRAYHLKRLRNAAFHFQRDLIDGKIREYFDQGTADGAWVFSVDRALERFFRRTRELRNENLDGWVHR
jgi:hypothetical protein